jgi:hypothetical protein
MIGRDRKTGCRPGSHPPCRPVQVHRFRKRVPPLFFSSFMSRARRPMRSCAPRAARRVPPGESSLGAALLGGGGAAGGARRASLRPSPADARVLAAARLRVARAADVAARRGQVCRVRGECAHSPHIAACPCVLVAPRKGRSRGPGCVACVHVPHQPCEIVASARCRRRRGSGTGVPCAW